MKKSSLLIGVVVVAAGIYYFGPSLLDSAVKKIVNKYGSEVTGTEVNLEGFSLHPTTGEAAIRKITIANPQNYKMPYLFELNNISVKVDLKSLTSDTVIIEDITVDKPAITYEMLSLTQNNIKEIQNNVNSYLNKSSSNDKAETTSETDSADQSAGKKVIIRHLAINDATLSAAAGDKDVSITLPDITMNNIGDDSKKAGSNIPHAKDTTGANSSHGIATDSILQGNQKSADSSAILPQRKGTDTVVTQDSIRQGKDSSSTEINEEPEVTYIFS